MKNVDAIYIHIPFCKNICSYCDFTKMYYIEKYVDPYLEKLEQEIKSKYKGEMISTIYIGGGTPSVLPIEKLSKLFEMLNIIKKTKDLEFTIECNISDITEDKLLFLKENGVNRLSIGVETFSNKLSKVLNRCDNKQAKEKITLACKIFDNVSVDLIYAIPGETIKDLEYDIDMLLNLNIKHISAYSLILEPHTKLYNETIDFIDEQQDRLMYDLICRKLSKYHHYEISNFAIPGFESRHNIKYWKNKYYYGFGLGSSGYLNNIRYTNTKNIKKYLDENYVDSEIKLTKYDIMEEEMFLGLRLLDGISIIDFKNKFNIEMKEVFPIDKLIKEGKLQIDHDNIKLNKDYIYISNDVFIEFLR